MKLYPPYATDSNSGLPGADGDDGLSAYEIAVNNGFIGTESEWLDSLGGSEIPLIFRDAEEFFTDPLRPTELEFTSFINDRGITAGNTIVLLDENNELITNGRYTVIDDSGTLKARGRSQLNEIDFSIPPSQQAFYVTDVEDPTTIELTSLINGIGLAEGQFFVFESSTDPLRIISRWQVFNDGGTLKARGASFNQGAAAVPAQALAVISAKEAAGATFTDGQKEAYYRWFRMGEIDGWLSKGLSAGVFTDNNAAANLVNIVDIGLPLMEIGDINHLVGSVARDNLTYGAIDMRQPNGPGVLDEDDCSIAEYNIRTGSNSVADIGSFDGTNTLLINSINNSAEFYVGTNASPKISISRANEPNITVGSRFGNTNTITVRSATQISQLENTSINNLSIPNSSVYAISNYNSQLSGNFFTWDGSNPYGSGFAWVGTGLTSAESTSLARETFILMASLGSI